MPKQHKEHNSSLLFAGGCDAGSTVYHYSRNTAYADLLQACAAWGYMKQLLRRLKE
jgi:hypothetical protein